VLELFAIEATPFWDDQTVRGKGGRWHVVFYATSVLDLLQSLGLDLHAQVRQRRIPDAILRSPKRVVSSFLRAYFACAGCASVKQGVILSTCSEDSAHTLQVLLLNYGILSRKRRHSIHIAGKSAEVFAREIGFGLIRKQEKLREYLAAHLRF